MFSTFTVQPLLRGVHLDDASVAASESSAPSGRSFFDRSSTVSPSGNNSPVPKSTGIFNRNTRPIVESLDSFENHLYLGTSDGYLLHYVIEEQISSQSDLPRSRLVRRRALGFGKKVVEKIMVISALRIAILLCDSTLTFYSLPDFQPFASQIHPPIKGVTAFCEDSSQSGHVAEDGSVRLCVTKRRIIQFYSLWPDAISEPKELSLPNGALVVTRWKNFICVADANDFNLIDSRVGRMIPVLPVVQTSNSGPNAQVLKPVCIAITENEFLLASATSSGQTAIGIFCSGAGDPVRGTLQFSSYPRALGIEFPYVAALLRGNMIEVHNILDQSLVQTIRFDSALEIRTLVQGPGLAVWMSSLARVLGQQSWQRSAAEDQTQQDVSRIATVLARVLFAGKDTVSALVTTPLALHADKLLREGRVEEALLLSEKATATISQENRHRERLQLELDFIHQKSGLIYLEETLFDDAFGLFLRGRIDPRAIIFMFPDVLQKQDILGDVKLFGGVRELLNQRGSLHDIINRTTARSGDQGTEFGNMLLTNAKEVFSQFLIKCKREYRTTKGRPSPIAEAIDTALLGLWVDNGNDKDLLQLLGGANACKEDLSEPKLRSAGKHYALSIWYKSHKNPGAALSIWKSLIQGELEDRSSAVSLQDMATLLMSSQDMTLIEEYGWWIVGQDETIGLKIFMPGDSKRAAIFDPDRVLESCKAKVSQEGIMTYLEYLVTQRKSETPEHHTMLSQLYVDNIVRTVGNSGAAAKHQELVNMFKEQQSRKLLTSESFRTLESAGIMDTFLSYLQSNGKVDLISSYRAKLSHLLQSISVVNADDILGKVKSIPILRYEVALLLARTGQYEECIGILVKEVKDYQGVEILCLNGGNFRNRSKVTKAAATTEGAHSKVVVAELEKRKKLFMILLQEYLGISEDDGGMNLTLRLLNSQSSYLDISEVVQFLPEYWSVEALQEYLLRSLRRSYHDFKEIQVVKGLSLGENLRISEELFQLYESQGPVVITANDICHVCGDAVADAVFVRTVDMRVIHLHCGSTTAAEHAPSSSSR
ncbi:transforming growth factor, beta receptor associated protein 1 [Mortierella sp. 14UC]|nr:transforming growth factor, beta receptor associated protein 1 [Mortierella sp. 14UC]